MHSLLTYIHFLGFAVMAACLTLEWRLTTSPLPTAGLQHLRRIDMLYGLTAGIMLASGITRLFIEKGVDYYLGNPWFWLKMGLFLMAGLLSAYPTMCFLKFKPPGDGQPFPAAQKIKRMVCIQLCLLTLIPLCAVLMARGWY